MMSSIHQGLFGKRWQEGGRGKGKLAFSCSPKQLPLIQLCVIKYYCCSWQMEPNWSSWLRGQPLRNSEGHLNLPEAIHTSPPSPTSQGQFKNRNSLWVCFYKHTFKRTRTATTGEMQHCLQNNDYLPDNILLLYYDAHMLPIHCRVRAANTDQRFCGILHYLEMFCSCQNKREKDQN